MRTKIFASLLLLIAAGCGPVTTLDDGTVDLSVSQPAAPSAQATPGDATRSPDPSAPGTNGCTFCNPTGYLVCQQADGTSCGVPGQSRRCIMEPICACEWGTCICNGSTGTWNCYY